MFQRPHMPRCAQQVAFQATLIESLELTFTLGLMPAAVSLTQHVNFGWQTFD